MIRLNWRTVVAVMWGRRHWQSATMSIMGFCVDWLRVAVVVTYNSTTVLRQRPCQVGTFWRRYWRTSMEELSDDGKLKNA
jgi:hypothetical protein